MDVTRNIVMAFVLTALAGLSTGIGSAFAYFIKKPKMIYYFGALYLVIILIFMIIASIFQGKLLN